MQKLSSIKTWVMLLYITVIILMLTAMMSCGGQKEVVKTERVIDSTMWRENESLKAKIAEQKTTYEKQLAEAKKSNVVFREVPCPPTHVDKDCQYDSLAKIIRMKDDIIASMQNSVKYYANGAIEYNGQISSANAEISKLVNEINTHYQRTIDLQKENDLLKVQVKKTEEAYSKKKKKRCLWWLWYLLGAGSVIGLLVWYNWRKGKSLSIHK